MEGLVDERVEILRFVAESSGSPAAKPRRRFWTNQRTRNLVCGGMLLVASVGFFLLVSLATVAVLSS